jgi:hypothetical protein
MATIPPIYWIRNIDPDHVGDYFEKEVKPTIHEQIHLYSLHFHEELLQVCL